MTLSVNLFFIEYTSNMASVKFYVVCFCAIGIFVKESIASTSFIENSEDKNHPGFCNIKDLKTGDSLLLLKPGASKKHPNDCSVVNCHEKYHVEIQSCGIQKGSEGCTFVEGRKDSYPECCGSYNCDKTK